METVIQLLREMLGTAFSLYLTTHGAHWNVEGPDFYQYHGLFKDQYEEIWASLDDVAEQLRALDAYAPSTMARYIELSRITDTHPAPIFISETLASLVQMHETYINLMVETLAAANAEGQAGLANFLGARIEAHQKQRWMLKASAKR